MEETLQQTITLAASAAANAAASVSDPTLAPATNADGLVFLTIAALGVAMALVYVPIRLVLTFTARSRRLRLLQRIRRLREDLGQPLPSSE
jgi:hypothetical protein